MVQELVGVRERVAGCEARHESEGLLHHALDPLRKLRGLGAVAVGQQFEKRVKLRREDVRSAQQQAVIRAAATPRPAGVVAFGAAHEKYAVEFQPGSGHAVAHRWCP